LKKLIVCEAELKTLSARHATVSLHTRVTREQGRFKADDLKVLAIELPKSDWLICGSKAFQFEAQKLLLEQGSARKIYTSSPSMRLVDRCRPLRRRSRCGLLWGAP
jgi:ferredoxin-NADP reductase